MSQTHVLVRCPECGGTGDAQGGVYQCDVCLGGRHLNVPRDPQTGGAPAGLTEWKDAELPTIRPNPYRLTY